MNYEQALAIAQSCLCPIDEYCEEAYQIDPEIAIALQDEAESFRRFNEQRLTHLAALGKLDAQFQIMVRELPPDLQAKALQMNARAIAAWRGGFDI